MFLIYFAFVANILRADRLLLHLVDNISNLTSFHGPSLSFFLGHRIPCCLICKLVQWLYFAIYSLH